MVICPERGADLHMVQLMPLPLTVSCFSKIQIGLPFWYWLTRVVLEKGPLSGCVCIYKYSKRFIQPVVQPAAKCKRTLNLHQSAICLLFRIHSFKIITEVIMCP